MNKLFKVSYAQNREDVIIAAFFKDVKKGFYVDVGANDPIDDSITYNFYKKGWTGINIEPNAELYKKISDHRPKDINLMTGVSTSKGELILRQYVNHGLSTFSSEVIEGYAHTSSDKTDTYSDVKVPVDSLAAILKKYANKKHIHFMKIDVEGYEYEVISSSDWKKFRPEMLCIEANHIVNDWRPVLKKAKYHLVYNDGLNDYYLAEESIGRAKQFDYANDILLDKQIINPGIANTLTMYEENLEELSVQKKILAELQVKHENVLKQRNELFLQLQRYQGIKRQSKMLAFSLYKKVYDWADSFSFPSKYIYPKTTVVEAKTFTDIQREINVYDKKVFTDRRIHGSLWRRALSVSVKGILDLIRFVIGKTIQFLRTAKRKTTKK